MLLRGAVIAVRLVDHLGDPVAGYRVLAYRPGSGGARELTSLANVHTTDDRGDIRLSGLPPGEYHVAAAPGPFATAFPPSSRVSRLQTFYPGVTSEADAQPVAVALGQEVAIFLQLAPP